MVTLECLYAYGAKFIEKLQYTLSDFECYFELVNELSSPYTGYEVLVPIVSVFDSVFASQLILCISFTGWLVNVLKWWLQEDRPYRWVRDARPCGRRCQGVSRPQPRKSGPGFPSGHSAAAAVEAALLVNWIERLAVDRDISSEMWKYFIYPMAAVAICSTMLARMYVSAHFPHQVVFGAALGLLLTPYLCVHVANPTIWGPHHFEEALTRRWHVLGAVAVTGISVVTAQNLALCGGYEPPKLHMGCHSCGDPKNLVPATPMGTLTRYTGSLFGWALAVTPIVQRYRHFTKKRSVVLSFMATFIINKTINEFMKRLDDMECKESYYVIKFCVNILKPIFYLRLIPLLAMYPYDDEVGLDLDKKHKTRPDLYYIKKQNSNSNKNGRR